MLISIASLDNVFDDFQSNGRETKKNTQKGLVIYSYRKNWKSFPDRQKPTCSQLSCPPVKPFLIPFRLHCLRSCWMAYSFIHPFIYPFDQISDDKGRTVWTQWMQIAFYVYSWERLKNTIKWNDTDLITDIVFFFGLA